MNPISKHGMESFYTSLKASMHEKCLPVGFKLHCLLIEKGYEFSPFLCCHLIRMYAGYGRVSMAEQVFVKLQKPDVFAYTAIISAYAKHGHGEKAIKLYHFMLHSNIQPDEHTHVIAMQASANMASVRDGSGIYIHVVENGFESNLFILNAVIHMYSKCLCFDDASTSFNMSQVHDVITWNVMLEAFVQQGSYHATFHLFSQMKVEGLDPDTITYINILKACSNMEALDINFHIPSPRG